jgi:anti-sigma B factor antagonist
MLVSTGLVPYPEFSRRRAIVPAVTTAIDKDKRARLTIYGNLTIRTAGQLVDAFDKLYNQDVTHYVVDLSKVVYLDSTGLSCLLRMQQRLEKVQGELQIDQVNEGAMEIFQSTRLDQVLHLIAAPGSGGSQVG